jgi:hypothetical protein
VRQPVDLGAEPRKPRGRDAGRFGDPAVDQAGPAKLAHTKQARMMIVSISGWNISLPKRKSSPAGRPAVPAYAAKKDAGGSAYENAACALPINMTNERRQSATSLSDVYRQNRDCA